MRDFLLAIDARQHLIAVSAEDTWCATARCHGILGNPDFVGNDISNQIDNRLAALITSAARVLGGVGNDCSR
jgi:hypothetical protein